ncbi:hypothetical protein CTKZ_24520 [Cellulomonas algicola]|uniref:Peptidase C39 domain-containing protein n=1 Tax=Cellulomonas algicola TaxID=2071633 RepID=A0A401V1U3_9CELL|nr:hypothetical protein CTKZ_24520 [Cellulomonas algicola]
MLVGAGASASHVVQLQHGAGNAAVARWVAGLAHTASTLVQRSPAADLIATRTSLGALDETALGADLATRARGGDATFVQSVLDELWSTDRDDVALAICTALDDAALGVLVASEDGRRLVDRMFDELTSGSVGDDEQQQADRLLRTKGATRSPESFEQALATAKVFPFRLPGITVMSDAIIQAERRPEGRIWVKQPVRVQYDEMFAEETRTLPLDVFISGIELPEDEIVGVRLYDLGGTLVHRPALILLQLSNEADTRTLTKIAEVAGIGLTLGTGSLAGLGIEASMTARVLLWADRAALALGTIASVVAEHRGEIVERHGDTGRTFLRYVDMVQSATAIYGFARTALTMASLVSGLRGSADGLRGAVSSADDPAAAVLRETDDVLARADEIMGARGGGPRPGGTEPETPTTPTTSPTTPSPTPDTPGPAPETPGPEPPGPGPDAPGPVPEPPAPAEPAVPRGFREDGTAPRTGSPSRPVYSQGQDPTCGPVSAGMAIETMGQPHDMAELVKSAGPDGMYISDLLSLVQRHHIDARMNLTATVGDLGAATSSAAGGNPAIALIRMPPGSSHAFHYVVVDGVTTRLGQQVVAVRNPWGTQYFELLDSFTKKFTGQAIMINYSF